MIIVLGLSGSGKSSQCVSLAATGDFQWLSVGQLLRTEMENEEHQEQIRSGKMVSDDVVIPLVDAKLTELKDNPEVLLDGYPRSLRQVEHLLEPTNPIGKTIRGVVHLVVPSDVARERLIARGRSDDHHEAIGERHDEYHRTIESIINKLRSAGVPIHEIDGDREIDEVSEDMRQAVAVK